MKKVTQSSMLFLVATLLMLGNTSNLAAQDDSAATLIREGQQAIQSGNLKKAAEKFKQVIDKDDDNAMAWQLYGYAIHGTGDLDEAIKAHEKAATFDETKMVALYNLGCAYAMKKDLDKSFDYLNKAVDAGFDDVNHYKSDTDLANLHDDGRFAKLISRIKGDDSPPAKEKSKKKKMSFEGVYEVTSGKRMGSDAERLPPSITVDDEVFRIPNPDGGEGFVMSYEADTSKDPIEVDFQIEEGPAPDAKALGIMKVDGEGTITLCYNPTGQDRPDEFESTEDNQCHLFVMKKKAPEFAAKDLIGEWTLASGSRAGDEVGKERLVGKITITEESITIPAGEDKFVMSYKFDTKASPVAVDMKILEGPAPEGSAALGIIKMEGDKVTLCYDSMGANRPEEFKTSSEDGFFMFELKKVKFD